MREHLPDSNQAAMLYRYLYLRFTRALDGEYMLVAIARRPRQELTDASSRPRAAEPLGGPSTMRQHFRHRTTLRLLMAPPNAATRAPASIYHRSATKKPRHRLRFLADEAVFGQYH
jgi:hypothetical protein